MAAWRTGEEDPFHTEVGYWLYDAAEQQIMRCFIVSRGVAVLAGGTAAPGDTEFAMRAELGSETFGVASNPHLDRTARTLEFATTVRIEGDDSFSYDEITLLQMSQTDEPLRHTDTNTLQRTG